MSFIQSHEWIYKNYPSVKFIRDTENGVVCYDAENSVVSIDVETAKTKSDEHVAEICLDNLRLKRNSKLLSCDWTQNADAPITAEKKAEWETYRQALRDITDTYTSLDDVVWPEEPV